MDETPPPKSPESSSGNDCQPTEGGGGAYTRGQVGEMFRPHAESIAESAADDVGIAPAVLIPLIIEVLPPLLKCLRGEGFTVGEVVNNPQYETRLMRGYWHKSYQQGGPKLTHDQAKALARHSMATAALAPAETVDGLTAAACSVATGEETGS